MKPAQFAKARETLGMSVSQLAENLGVPPEAVDRWETGESGIPLEFARAVAFMAAHAERAKLMEASGLPECEWVKAWEPPDPDRTSFQESERRVKELERHQAGCAICQARVDYEREHLPPPPEPPLSPGLKLLGRFMEMVQRLPAWARPAAYGAAIVAVLTIIRAAFLISVRGANADTFLSVAVATGIALGMGAAGGLAYQLVREPFKQFGRFGDYLTGIVCVGTAGAAVGVPAHFIAGPFIDGIAVLAWAIVSVVMGLVVGHSWFREPTTEEIQRDQRQMNYAYWIFGGLMVLGAVLRYASGGDERDLSPAELMANVKQNPSDAESRRQLGSIRADSGRYDEAFQLFSEAVQLEPKNAWSHNGRGWAALNLRRYELAATEFPEAIALDSTYRQPRVNLANLLSYQNRCDEAVSLYRESAKVDSTASWPHTDAADCLRRLKRVDEAEIEARIGVRLRPTSLPAHRALIETFLHQNRYDSALVYVREAVRIAPNSASAAAYHGTIAYYADKRDEAREAFQKAIKINGKILEQDDQARQIWNELKP